MELANTEYDPLVACLEWFQKQNPLAFVPITGCVDTVGGGVTSLLLFRQDNFQGQLFIAPPNTIVPTHAHPDVDSFEIFIGGQMKLSHLGKFIDADLNPDEDGYPQYPRGYAARARPNEEHGVVFGPAGGVFVSIQRWLNGLAPSCVGRNWRGRPLDDKHFDQITSGAPVKGEEPLKPEDAAPLDAEP